MYLQLSPAIAAASIVTVLGLGTAVEFPRAASHSTHPGETTTGCQLDQTDKNAWKTVDSFTGGDARVRAAAASPKAVFLVGTQNQHWIVRRSLDRGETWKTVDRFSPPGAQQSATALTTSFSANDIAVDLRNGHIYVVGGDAETSWFVRKSTDLGESWKTVDHFDGVGQAGEKIAVDGNGVLYVAGPGPALLRRSTDGGLHWTTQDFAGQFERFAAIATTPDGQVFIGAPAKRGWVILHSPNGTSEWRIVDRYPEGDSLLGALASEDGRVVFFGSERNGETLRSIIRQSGAHAPTAWETIDQHQPLDFNLGFGHAAVHTVAFAQDGSIFAAGQRVKPWEDRLDFFARREDPQPSASAAEDASEILAHAAGSSLSPESTLASTTTAEGDILVALTVPETDGGFSWLVKKLACK